MNKNIKYCLISLVLLLILIALLLTGYISKIDSYFATLIYHQYVLTSIFKIVTFFGSFIGIVLICIFLIFIIKDLKKLIWLYTTIISSTLINNIVKIIIARPRPLLEHLVEETTYSFPSGHAMATLTFYGAIIFLIWQSNISKKLKRIFTFLLMVLIILIGFSRIYLNVHHLSDILGGYLFSIIIINLAIYFYQKIKF